MGVEKPVFFLKSKASSAGNWPIIFFATLLSISRPSFIKQAKHLGSHRASIVYQKLIMLLVVITGHIKYIREFKFKYHLIRSSKFYSLKWLKSIWCYGSWWVKNLRCNFEIKWGLVLWRFHHLARSLCLLVNWCA